MLKDYLDWPYIEQVFRLEHRFVNLTTGEVKEQASLQDLLQFKRTYWDIENGLHDRRDVSLNEDRCRSGDGHPQ